MSYNVISGYFSQSTSTTLVDIADNFADSGQYLCYTEWVYLIQRRRGVYKVVIQSV